MTFFRKPNTIIVSTSLLFSVSLFFISISLLEGVVYDFSINLSASMLAIAITVVLVDILRELHLETLYKTPRTTALTKLLGSNWSLALVIAMKKRETHPTLLDSLMGGVHDVKDRQGSDFYKNSILPIKELAKIDPNLLLSEFSNEELITKLKPTLLRIRDTYTEINDRYIFSFNNIAQKSDYVRILECLDSVITHIEFAEDKTLDLDNLFKTYNASNEDKRMTINSLIGGSMSAYLVSIKEFVNNYTKTSS